MATNLVCWSISRKTHKDKLDWKDVNCQYHYSLVSRCNEKQIDLFLVLADVYDKFLILAMIAMN